MSASASSQPIVRAPSRLVAAAAERILLGAAARVRHGRLTVVLPGGWRRVFGDVDAARSAEIHVHDPHAAVRLLLHG